MITLAFHNSIHRFNKIWIIAKSPIKTTCNLTSKRNGFLFKQTPVFVAGKQFFYIGLSPGNTPDKCSSAWFEGVKNLLFDICFQKPL